VGDDSESSVAPEFIIWEYGRFPPKIMTLAPTPANCAASYLIAVPPFRQLAASERTGSRFCMRVGMIISDDPQQECANAQSSHFTSVVRILRIHVIFIPFNPLSYPQASSVLYRTCTEI
jgi:hypothetical protein